MSRNILRLLRAQSLTRSAEKCTNKISPLRSISTQSYPLSHIDLGNDPDMANMPAASRQPQRDLPLEESRAVMRENFAGKSGNEYYNGWEALWQKGDFLPWDRMVSSPALSDTLNNHSHVIGTSKLVLPDGSTRRKRALVPGCGRGVDVMLLQAYGYDVIGTTDAATLSVCN